MVREIDELEEILDRIREKVLFANRMDELDELLISWGLNERSSSNSEERYRSGKIVVIGASDVKEKTLVNISEEFRIGKDRLEFCLDYNKAQKYNYEKLRYNPSYSVVLFGAVPHSTTGKGDSSSVVAEIEKQKGYPPVKRLISGGELKITKSNFRKAIQELLTENIISSDC